MANVYLDKRFTVNGLRSHIKLDNLFNLTKYIDDRSNGASYNFLNGITELNGNVKLGGLLTEEITVIEGDPLLTRSFYFGGPEPLNGFGILCSEDIDIQGDNVNIGAGGDVTLSDLGAGAQIRVSQTISSGIELRTSDINNALTTRNSVFTVINENTGEGEWKPTKFVAVFNDFDFNAEIINYSAATHGRGSDPLVQVFIENTPGNWTAIYPGSVELTSIQVTSTGEVVIEATAGEEFNGKVVIL